MECQPGEVARQGLTGPVISVSAALTVAGQRIEDMRGSMPCVGHIYARETTMGPSRLLCSPLHEVCRELRLLVAEASSSSDADLNGVILV